MKKTVIYISVMTMLLGLGACKKQLNLLPFNAIELSQAFQTVKDATTWNNGLYSELRGRVYGNYTISQEVQADYLNASLDFGNRNGSPHKWGTEFQASDAALSNAWSGYYFALKNVNTAIAGFDLIKTTVPAEQALLSRYKGEAYLARAYYYSELIIRFAKPYEPATAATDPGVPLVLTYDLNAQPARSTVKQVYDQILADITQAKTLLAAVNGAQGANKFTKDAANALDARVRLYMQDWAGAMSAVQAVLGPTLANTTYPLITTQSEMNTMWVNDLGKETITQLSVVRTSETAPTMNIYLGFVPAQSKFTPDFIPTQGIVDMYSGTDIRKGTYFGILPTRIQGVDYSLYLVNKYRGNPSLFTTTTTNYQQAPKVFRAAELFLIYAEAAQRLGGANEPLALTALNLLRVARGTTALVGLTGNALRDAIRDERTRELAFEGFRLWDLKRWHLGFTRMAPQNLGPIQIGPLFHALTIAADNPQFVWGIPTNDVTINPNIGQANQNPGW